MDRNAARNAVSLASGLVFGLGLLLSGMANPAKVLAFLDIAGRWDPSLVLVMGGAILIAAPAYAWAKGRGRPVFDGSLHLPTATRVDPKLIVGSALFGIGWGIAGFCPGPALVNVATGNLKVLIFGTAMLAGMLLHGALRRWRRP